MNEIVERTNEQLQTAKYINQDGVEITNEQFIAGIRAGGGGGGGGASTANRRPPMNDIVDIVARALDPNAFTETYSAKHYYPKNAAHLFSKRRAKAIRQAKAAISAYEEARVVDGICRICGFNREEAGLTPEHWRDAYPQYKEHVEQEHDRILQGASKLNEQSLVELILADNIFWSNAPKHAAGLLARRALIMLRPYLRTQPPADEHTEGRE